LLGENLLRGKVRNQERSLKKKERGTPGGTIVPVRETSKALNGCCGGGGIKQDSTTPRDTGGNKKGKEFFWTKGEPAFG